MEVLPALTKITLCSESDVKTRVLKEVVAEFSWLSHVTLCFKDSHPPANPVQPINSGYACSLRRIDHLGPELQTTDQLVVAIENEIQTKCPDGHERIVDVCNATIRRGPVVVTATSYGIPVPEEFYKQAIEASDPDYPNKAEGLSVTVGSIIEKAHPEVKANNWMADPRFGGQDRADQIKDALRAALKKVYIAEKTAYHKDYPKPGVVFKDLSYVCADNVAFRYVLETLKQALVVRGWADKITKIMGFDARGFIYGSILAKELDLGFVMIRKKGKLPGKTFKIKYTTEYSEETFELVHDLVGPEDVVLLVDDVVATGGTFKAGVDAIEAGQKGKVIGCLAVLQVDALIDIAKAKLAPTEIITLF